MRRDPKTERLTQVDLFRNAPRRALDLVARTADEVTMAAGATLITQGSASRTTYVIVTGSVIVTVDGRDVATIGEGETVGELGIFGVATATATVTTAENTSLLVLPNNRIAQIIEKTPGFALALANELAHRLEKANRQHLSKI